MGHHRLLLQKHSLNLFHLPCSCLTSGQIFLLRRSSLGSVSSVVLASHISPFTVKVVKVENGNSAPQPHEPHVSCWGAACGWWLPFWSAPRPSCAGRHGPAGGRFSWTSLSSNWPLCWEFSPSPSRPSYGRPVLALQKQRVVTTRSCLKTSVGYWHVVCAPQHGVWVLHCPLPRSALTCPLSSETPASLPCLIPLCL